jgi:DNA polymerase-3 subunit epsilon
MSGLRPRADRILSVGMVPIRQGVIRFGERYYSLVRPPDLEGLSTEGVRAHHLLPSDIADAPRLTEVLPEVDRRLREGTLLVHFAQLDLAFLRDGYRRCGMRWPHPPLVDTMNLLLQHHQRLQQWTPHPPPPRTALAEARVDLGLPAYPAHHALSDALATAELFLVLRSKLGLRKMRGIT